MPISKIIKPDILGATASGLCIVHCIATPLIFLTSAYSATCCHEAPVWWQLIDYLFLVISFIAIQVSIKNTTKRWMGAAMMSSWVLLLLAVLNETFEIVALPELAIYFPAIGMIALHLYNKKYCQCTGNDCCA